MKQIFLEKLYFKNFRNLDENTLNFSPRINCIFGKNGNGKTNILEAIYYLIYRKSFRKKSYYSQLLNYNGENPEFIIKTLFANDENKLQYSLKVDEKETQFYLNSKREKKKADIHAIIINPFDSFLFFNRTSERRDWINHALSEVDDEYKKVLRDFNKALKMRNALLAKFYGPEDIFEKQARVLDQQLAKSSVLIIKKRKEFLDALRPKIEENFIQIFNTPHRIQIRYVSEIENMSEDEVFHFYNDSVANDRLQKSTRRGLHLDDYEISIDNQPAGEFGSVGQQKVSYLSLLFAYVGYLEERAGTLPIMLIDDISGELDSVCWKNLLEYLETKKLQVFITTANDAFREELSQIEGGNRLLVENGEIRELN